MRGVNKYNRISREKSTAKVIEITLDDIEKEIGHMDKLDEHERLLESIKILIQLSNMIPRSNKEGLVKINLLMDRLEV